MLIISIKILKTLFSNSRCIQAAEASTSRVVLLDLPRNTSKNSLGRCALQAGYCGNIKLEEHYLNGRLKTVTAYFGSDYSGLINEVDVVQNKPKFLDND